ncbi:TIGR04283 family arsenosugar biosynthesis glycosyltransferase [Methylobacter sp. BlB1]|jgi:rSAM/selenodomain-associated transferase 2|uniref:TIGR04283 family arsenosugar biosynthesis glycosyltransferase n=1 Tax=Methylobacter sp. BlB1 TaxID=2785914 RepID=UPI001893D553|nr:TIGR04283 family arsenosugar biosynthesis glycosyltransferase [Methylobacter sp. BlB1]MBF6649456.1 TIGR04283 family arsenosugar biosynthesis glycosyltransferase [Methylobacter sp. BlB1]
MKFSIIIPALNEAQNIQGCLSALQPLRNDCELIVVDGGSTDGTPAIAEPLADQVISAPKGRARQMNAGARQATGEVLLFLHADTFLPDNAIQLIREQINRPAPWGRFDIRLSGDHFMLKVISQMMNWRSRLTGIATGDQAIFVTHEAFTAVGGYPDISLMEDIALCKALNKISPPLCLKAKVNSSGRRWLQFGLYKTILFMWSLRLRYFFGADPKTLARLYSGGHLWKP